MSDPDLAAADERRFLRRVLVVLGLVALMMLAWQLRAVLVMLFGAVVVAAVFRSLGDPIARWTNLRYSIAVIIAVLLIFGGLGAMAALFGAQIGQQVQLLTKTLPDAWQSFEQRIGSMGFGEELRRMVGAGGGSSGSFSSIGRVIMSVGGGIVDALVVLFGGIFIAAQPRFYRTGAIKLVPEAKRGLMSDAMNSSEKALRLWLKGQLIAMVVVGFMTGFGLWMLGMPSALALGLLAGLLEFIPFAGPIVAAIPAILLALSVSPELALSVVLLYTAVQQLEGLILQPLVQQYAVDLPGVVLIFSLIAFGILFGTIGIIFAAPLTVVTYVMVKKLYVQETLGTKTPIPGEDED